MAEEYDEEPILSRAFDDIAHLAAQHDFGRPSACPPLILGILWSVVRVEPRRGTWLLSLGYRRRTTAELWRQAATPSSDSYASWLHRRAGIGAAKCVQPVGGSSDVEIE